MRIQNKKFRLCVEKGELADNGNSPFKHRSLIYDVSKEENILRIILFCYVVFHIFIFEESWNEFTVYKEHCEKEN